jgi:hypothetical protein
MFALKVVSLLLTSSSVYAIKLKSADESKIVAKNDKMP